MPAPAASVVSPDAPAVDEDAPTTAFVKPELSLDDDDDDEDPAVTGQPSQPVSDEVTVIDKRHHPAKSV